MIDQFEQWLHAASPEENARLAGALRQCDGGNLQCLVLVRDEFWLAISRLFRELEVPIVEGQNSALVDLFDTEHAQRVLAEFGRAFRRLPENSSDMTPGQLAFIHRAVRALAQDGTVNCLRLALFAEMMKGTPWLPENLTQMGGIEGVGIAFLEATFSGPTAPPECRLYERAARGVLTELLPSADSDIRGHSCSYLELQRAAGCRPDQFDRLIHLLDSETRLITPTDPAVSDVQDPLLDPNQASGPQTRHYQLTHDYLVPSIRAWLTRRQRETHAGRAELLLAERAQLWESRRESRQLPTMLETLTILLLTRKSAWSETEQRTMEAAGQLHARRLLASVMIIVGALLVVFVTRRELDRDRREHGAKQLVRHLLAAELAALPEMIDDLQPDEALVREQLRTAARIEPVSKQLRAHLALVRTDPASVRPIISMMHEAAVEDLPVIRDALERHADASTSQLWQAIQSSDVPNANLLPLAYQLAYFDADSENWPSVAPRVATALFEGSHLDVGQWTRALEPAGQWLITPLEKVFRDDQVSPTDRVLAANILASFSSRDPQRIARWIVHANADQFPALLPILKSHRVRSRVWLSQALSSDVRDADSVSQVTRAALALMHLNYEGEVWHLFRDTTEPDLRTSLIGSLYEYGVPADKILDQLEMDLEPAIQIALLLALHDYPVSILATRPEFVRLVKRLYSSSRSSGVHSAAESLLRQWDLERPKLTPLVSDSGAAPTAKDWWVTPDGHTMIVIRGPNSFDRGSPEHETGRDPIEYQETVELSHSFALAAHEVTVAQYLAFRPAFPYATDISQEDDHPVNRTSWYDAARYCRWLSDREGISEDQMCYPPESEIREGMQLLDEQEMLSRTGYRLPTATEWEYAARAKSKGAWSFGNDPAWLRFYAMYLFNAEERAWPVGTARPNALGLFNMHGNVAEWCQTSSNDLPIPEATLDRQNASADVNANERVFRGGGYESRTKLTRSAKLYSYAPTEQYSFIGFRIARTVKD